MRKGFQLFGKPKLGFIMTDKMNNRRIIWSTLNKTKMIESLVVNQINFKRINVATTRSSSEDNPLKPGEIDVTFKMSIPKWCNDKELIKESSHSILYSGNVKKNRGKHLVNLKNVDKKYPRVGNNKFFCITKRYNIIDWISKSIDFTYFLSEEREKYLREVKSNIKLQEIGEKTKEWNMSCEGKFYTDERVNYGLSNTDPNEYLITNVVQPF